MIRLFREYEFRTLIERLPAMTGESAVDKVQALREVATSGTVAAARVGTERPSGWGSGRPIRAGSLGGEGLQLSLDFDTVSRTARVAGAGADADGDEAAGACAASGEAGGAREPVRFDDLPTALGATISDPGRIEVLEAAGLAGVEGWLAEQTVVGASIVSDDPRPRRGTAQAFAVAGRDGRVIAGWGAEAADGLRRMVEARGIPIVAHEAKPILETRFAGDADAETTPVEFDTQIAAYILNAALRSQSIADVVAERLDLVLPPPKELEPVHRAGLEALSALAVRDPLARALQEEGLERLFREIELPLIPVLARMEAMGIAVDLEALAVLDREFRTEIERLEAEIYAAVGHQFTIGSPKQLGDILFVELQLPKGKRTKTGYSTDASVLEELVGVHPVIQPVLDWRIYTKLRSTYVEALPSLIADDGRLHTTFHQAVASTGRLSSSDPNLQNIPIRTPLGRRIRRAFVAGSPDTVLVAADYSQIELRIMAHVAGDENLKDAFARQADIHRETAARVLNKPPEEITADERSMAKMVNFGLAYGMSDFGLSTRAGISRQEAQEFINSYFAAYSGHQLLHAPHQGDRAPPGLRHDAPRAEAAHPGAPRRQRRAARRGRADGDQHADPGHRRGHRQDRDDPARRAAGREGFKARALLQVHDELLLEAPKDEVDRLIPLLRETMEGALPLDVPLTVDVKVGTDWESMTPVSRRDAILAEADEAPADAGGPRRALIRCRSCPKSKPLPATFAGWLSARASPGSGSSWLRTLRSQDPDAFERAVVGRGIVGTSRRAKLVVLDLDGGVDERGRPLADDGAALTIHLKMTGQLFVVRAGQAEDRYTRLVLEFEDGRELRFRDIRKFGRVGVAWRNPATGDLEGELGGAKGFKGFGPEPLDPAFTAAGLPNAAPGAARAG